MSNVPLMFQPLVKYVDFQGRSRRSEFWLWVLFRCILNAVISTVAMSLVFSTFSGVNWQSSDPNQFMGPYMRIMPLVNIANLIQLGLFLPTLAVAVRRLHDINRSGWWVVMPMVVGFVGFVIFFIIFGTQLFTMVGHEGQMSDAEGLKFVLGLLGSAFLCIFLPLLIANIVMLVFYVTDGTPGTNRFGADPKGRGVPATPEVMF